MSEDESVKCIDLYRENLTNEERCHWVQTTEDCITESYVDYLSIFFCNFNDDLFGFKFFLLILWLVYLFTAIQTVASSFMCSSLFKISKQLSLSENLSSVTLFSFGVATPCIFSAISGIMNEKPIIVIGALFGSASFITQLIIGSIFALRTFRIETLPYLRDALFYLVLIVWIFWIFIIKKEIQRFDAYGFLIFYAIFILVAFLTPRQNLDDDGEEQEINDEIEFELSDTQNSLNITAVDEDKELAKGEWILRTFFRIFSPIDAQVWRNATRQQKLILIIKLPILFFVQLTAPLIDGRPAPEKLSSELRFRMFIQMILGPQLILEAINLNENTYAKDVPISMVVLILSIFIALFFYYFVKSPALFEIYSSWHTFVLSVFWVYLICEETVSFLRALSIKLDLSEEFIGLTILAWGNASLDLFADIKIVLEGKPRLASSATIVAPFISLLLGVGIPCTLLFITKSNLTHLPVRLSGQLIVMFISVTLGLLFTTFQLILNRFRSLPLYGGFLILFYLAGMILEFTLEFRVWSFPLSQFTVKG